MKCKNCGANYKTRELKCPYCNTENLIGKIWQAERSQAELEYENEKKQLGKHLLSPYMVERLLNRAILVLIGLYIVSFVIILLVFMLSEPIEKLYFSINKEEIEAQMAEYYEAGEYEKLDLYMEEKFVEHRDYYAYTQATSLNFDYNSYLECRLEFEALSEEEKMTDDYCLKYALVHSVDAYNLDCGIYSELDETNREMYETYQKDIMAYWVGTLGLSEEKVEELISIEYSFDEELESIIQDIKERRCW